MPSFLEQVQLSGHLQHLDNSTNTHYFMGYHGTNVRNMSNLVPYLSLEVENRGSNHSNPDPYQHAFLMANNLAASLHYAHLNAISGEVYDALSDPNYHDDSVILTCFLIEEAICGKPIYGKLIGFNADKQLEQTLGEEFLLPKTEFPTETILPLFRIAGAERLFPLINGETIY